MPPHRSITLQRVADWIRAIPYQPKRVATLKPTLYICMILYGQKIPPGARYKKSAHGAALASPGFHFCTGVGGVLDQFRAIPYPPTVKRRVRPPSNPTPLPPGKGGVKISRFGVGYFLGGFPHPPTPEK